MGAAAAAGGGGGAAAAGAGAGAATSAAGLAAAGAPPPAPSFILRSLVPGDTVAPSSTRSSVITPAAGEGTGTDVLSVSISQMTSSSATESPTAFSPLTSPPFLAVTCRRRLLDNWFLPDPSMAAIRRTLHYTSLSQADVWEAVRLVRKLRERR